MLRLLLIASILAAPATNALLMADSTSAKPEITHGTQTPIKNLPIDPEQLAASINGSFYHPDQLPGIQCTVTVDWPAFYSGLKVKVPESRMRAIDGLQIHSSAVRLKAPDVTFGWVNGPADTKDQLEGGVKQIIDGFYKTYWSFMSSPPISKASDIGRVEAQPDGTTKLYESDANNNVEIDLDQNHAPTHYDFNLAAFKGTFDLQYVDSPKPGPGDLRRLSSMHVLVNIGASTMNVNIKLDYQPVEGFIVPDHVTYEIVGAYTIPMEFVGCSVIKGQPAFVISPAQ